MAETLGSDTAAQTSKSSRRARAGRARWLAGGRRALGLFSRPVWLVVYGLYERLLEEQVQAMPMPGHIGIILDGNRRHACASGMRNPEAIYRLGADKLDDILA
jgi:short-chain Z-isoprenyl diphosphate synthase